MIKTFTRNDVLLYIYNELPEKQRKIVEEFLICNPDAFDFYDDLKSVKKQLDTIIKTPSKRTIDRILNYSKTFNLHSIKE